MPSISLHAMHAMHAMHQSEYFRNKVAEARKRLRRAEVSVPRRLSRGTDPDGHFYGECFSRAIDYVKSHGVPGMLYVSGKAWAEDSDNMLGYWHLSKKDKEVQTQEKTSARDGGGVSQERSKASLRSEGRLPHCPYMAEWWARRKNSAGSTAGGMSSHRPCWVFMRLYATCIAYELPFSKTLGASK